jgi:hypothetical protein
MTKDMNPLVEAACQVAMRAAASYLQAHNLRADDSALAACLRSHCKIALPAALHDAKEALDCGMGQAAEATFRASMALAGIEAAKEAGQPMSLQAA